MAGEPCEVCGQVDGHKMSCPTAKGRVSLSVTLEVAEVNAQRVPMTWAERRGAATAAAYAAAIDRFAELAGLGLPNVVGAECQQAATRAWEDVMRTTREVRDDE